MTVSTAVLPPGCSPASGGAGWAGPAGSHLVQGLGQCRVLGPGPLPSAPSPLGCCLLRARRSAPRVRPPPVPGLPASVLIGGPSSARTPPLLRHPLSLPVPGCLQGSGLRRRPSWLSPAALRGPEPELAAPWPAFPLSCHLAQHLQGRPAGGGGRARPARTLARGLSSCVPQLTHCVQVHTTHTHPHTCIHTHLHPHTTYTYTHHTHVHIHAHIPTPTYYIHIHTTHMYTYTHTQTLTHIHSTHTHTTHTTHTYTHTIHTTHTQTLRHTHIYHTHHTHLYTCTHTYVHHTNTYNTQHTDSTHTSPRSLTCTHSHLLPASPWLLAAAPPASLPTCAHSPLVNRASGRGNRSRDSSRGPRSFSFTVGLRLQPPSGWPCWRRPSLCGQWPGGL